MSKKTHKDSGQDAKLLIETFRDNWPRGKMSLLTAHIFYALDEVRDFGGWVETEDMDEAEKMFLELLKDFNKLVPERREKVNLKVFEKELSKEEIGENDIF